MRETESVTVNLLPLVRRPVQRAPMESCPVHTLRRQLRNANLRPTRQRIALGWILFAKGNRHVTAEMIYEEAKVARAPVSVATVYNTLNQFTQAGLLREIAVEGSKAYFDTNPSPHAHFLFEDTGALTDIPNVDFDAVKLPHAPEGYEIDRIELVIRVRRVKPVV